MQFPAPTDLTYPKYLFSGWECGPVTYAVYNSDDASTQYLIDNILSSAGLSGPDIYVGAVWNPTYWNDYAEPWTQGDGSEGNPYQISTSEQLAYLSDCTASGPAVTDFSGKYFELTTDLDMSDHYWVPIGSFAGNFDGQNHVVSGVENLDYSGYTGFFSEIMEGAEVSNLGIEDVYLSGSDHTGGLAGVCSGTIIKCHSTGLLRTDSSQVGGLVGYAGNISDCYARGNVGTESASNVGGFVGQNTGTIAKCYSTGSTMGDSNVKGGCGFNNGGLVEAGCYFDAETNGIYTEDTFYGYNTGSMKIKDIYTSLGWDFVDEAVNGEEEIWAIDAGINDGYPYISGPVEPTADIYPVKPNGEGTSADPYQIAGPENLLWMNEYAVSNALNGIYFKQTADIDMSGVANFTPIGHPTYGFQGIYDGDYHSINNLVVDVSSASSSDTYGGLFSYISEGTVKSLKFNDAAIKVDAMYASAGVVAGKIAGSLIQEVQVAGESTVSTEGIYSSNAGSIVGQAWASSSNDISTGAIIQACSGEADVTSTMTTSYIIHTGGIVGQLESSMVYDCISTGAVYAAAPTDMINTAMTGGTVGLANSSYVKNCVALGMPSTLYTTNSIGELIGYLFGNEAKVTGCFTKDIPLEAIGVNYVGTEAMGIYSGTEEELKVSSLYSGFSQYRWNIVNGSYPELQWPADLLTEANAYMDTAEAELDAADIKFQALDTYNSVTRNFTLPTSSVDKNVEITWAEKFGSEYLDISNETGYVERPLFGEPDAEVQLVATLELAPAESREVVITITIKAKPEPPAAPNGTGTESDPYTIDDSEDLQWISYMLEEDLQANCFLGEYFEQTADIDMSGVANFTPIGTSGSYFRGTYNGNSHMISNLTIVSPDPGVGLFGWSSGDIENVILKSATIFAKDGSMSNTILGGIVATLDSGNVINCNLLDDCTLTTSSGDTYMGGIAGYMKNGVIEECSNAAEFIVASSPYDDWIMDIIGGMVGLGAVGTVQNCYNAGNVTNLSSTVDKLFVGGVVGLDVCNSMEDDVSKPEGSGLELSSANFLSMTLTPMVIKNCYNVGNTSTGEVVGEDVAIGGIIGVTYTTAESSSLNNFYLVTVADLGCNDANIIFSVSGKAAPVMPSQLVEYGMTAKTDTEMKTPATFTEASWDAADVWYLENGKYPELNGLINALPSEYDTAIQEAAALIPSSFTAVYGTHTNLLTYLNSISGMSDKGVTMTISGSDNANVANTGAIIYTTANAVGLVTVHITKGDGSPIDKQINVTIPAHQAAYNDNNNNNDHHNNPPVPTGVVIGVNGQDQSNAATGTQQNVNGVTVTTITVDGNRLNEYLNNMPPTGNNVVTIGSGLPGSGAVTGQLTGATVKAMENKEAVLEIRTGNATYTLPASQINIDNISSQLDANVPLGDIQVSISVGAPPNSTVAIVQNTANSNSYQIVAPPVEFNITCTYNGRTIDVSRFNGYVERTVAIPEDIDPSRITTGIVLNNDGTFCHVPTTIIEMDGRYYARINSLTNSIYSVIWNPVTFKDVEKHWVKNAANDLGSRLVVAGDANGNFNPDTDITRAEFVMIVFKALGLQPGSGITPFKDVKSTDKYAPYVETAYKYGIVTGYNGMFNPDSFISRAEAMAIVDRMMKITNYQVTVSDTDSKTLLTRYTDFAKGSSWAEASILKCLKSEIMVGKGNGTIDPQSNITNAEAATVVHRLLVKAELIN